MSHPAPGDPDYWQYAVLFNDVTFAPRNGRRLLFSQRHAIADYLWEQGWRRYRMSERKIAESYCEAIEGEFAWFSQLCMAAPVAKVVDGDNEFAVCAEHVTDDAVAL